jgi:MraZ protein
MQLHLLGEFDCTADSKGRVKMPSQLLKQLGEQHGRNFVLSRGFEKCLMLYPRAIWDEMMEKISALNFFNKKNRDFIRHFQRGASEIELDEADRFLISKRLLAYADIEKELLLTAFNNQIEIWSPVEYENFLADTDFNFSDAAEEILGKKEGNSDESQHYEGSAGGEYASG